MKHARIARPLFARPPIWVATGFVIAAVAGSAGARLRPPAPGFASVSHAAEPATADDLRPAERAFVQQASALSRFEMSLAELGVNQAASADLRAFAQQLVEDCRQLRDSIDALARKKSVTLLAATGASKDSYTRLSEKSGADFDREFIQSMVPANEEMMRTFQQALSETAKDSDLRELAGTYLPVLRDHLNKAKDLRKAIE